MKILFVVPRFHTNMIGWVKALKAEKCEVIIHAIIKGRTEDYTEIEPAIFAISSISKKIISLLGQGGANMPRGFPNPVKYFKVLKQLKPDVIIVRDISRWFSFLAAASGRLIGANIIIYSLADLYSTYPKKRKLAFDFTTFIFKAIWITPILGDRNHIKNLPKRMFYVPFVVDPIEYVKTRNKTPIVLTIGKFVERKNHLFLLQVLDQLKNENYEFNLIIVGEKSTTIHDDNYETVMDYVNGSNIRNNVSIKCNVPYNEMKHLFEKIDLFILPASNEPAGISVLEALSFSNPVICSSTCGTRCYIDHLENGYIFQDKSFEDLKNAIVWYLQYPDKNQLILNCKSASNKNISAANYVNLFDTILDKSFGLRIKA